MAYSPIEDKYLSALTSMQFPDEPPMPEPTAPEQAAPAGQRPGDVLVAEAGSRNLPEQAYSGQYPDSMKAIEPTVRERLASILQSSFEGLGMDRYKARQNAQTLIGGGSSNLPLNIGLADFVPFLGTGLQTEEAAIMGGESIESAKRGDLGTAALQAGGAAAGLIPGAASTIKTGKAMLPKAGEMAIKSMEMLGTPVQMNIVPPGPNLVSTRLPTAVKKTEDPLTSRLVIDLQAAKQDPEAFARNVALIRQYPNFASKSRNTDKQAEDFITEVQNNLLYLHDKVPESTRQRSKLWYDGARNIADRFSAEYGVPDQAVSGVLAVLSPQKDWFMNVSLGQRVLDIATKQKSTRWDSSMDAVAKTIFTDPKHAPILKSIRGKTLDEVKQPAAKAMWLRTYDQANNPREHQIISPEGDFIGVRMNQDGKSPTQTGWGSLNEIGKAIVILEDPRIDTISINLGQQHKVRNFYSNIYAPNDPAGPVTIDTHAVAAGLLRPLSGKSREVLHNFGSNVKGEVGPANSSITGVQGTYGIYAEAYRRAAQERGILPREMQSITWEAVRGLYPETFKSQAKNVEQIDGIWLQYRKGKMSLQEARDEVFKVRSIDPPEWERAGLRSGSAQGVQPAGDAGELSGAGISGGGSPGAGGVQPAATNSSSVKRGRSAPKSGAK
jgi:hypothetical protein